MVALEAQTFTKEIEKAMNNALDIHKSEGMNVAHLQSGNLEDGVLGNTGGSAVQTIQTAERGTCLSLALEKSKKFNECLWDKKKPGWWDTPVFDLRSN